MATDLLVHLIERMTFDPLQWVTTALCHLCRIIARSGGKLIALGILSNIALALVLREIVALGGPIPLTPGVVAGMGAWLAFSLVLLVSSPIELLYRYLPFSEA